jgi:hypothetical protein
MRGRRIPAVLIFVIALASVAAGAQFAKGPYIQSLGETSVTIAWETDQPGEAEVEYGPRGVLSRVAKPAGAERLRRVEIKNLAPGTAYSYKVVDGGARSLGYTFTTLTASGPFTFAAYGDTRTNPLDHAQVVMGIAGSRPAFVVHTGDLVGDGRNDKQWGPMFFGPAGPLMARTAVFTTPGNHERESANYYRYLGQGEAKWYSFDCSNAHFVMLNSCLPLEAGSDQYKWLEADLAATDKRWRIAAFHHPLYSSSSHGSSHGIRRSIEPILAMYSVDLVFVGHDHVYERTYPVASAFESVHPVTHVVTGGGGAPRYKVAGDFFTASKMSTLNYCVVSIDGDVLRFDAYDGNGQKIDAFDIRKSGDGYEGDYLARTVPRELADVEAMVQDGLGWHEYDRPEAEKQENLEFTFTAPQWGDVELAIRWDNPEKGLTVSPSGADVVVPAGGSVTVKATATMKPDERDLPSAQVAGKTKLGEFKMKAAPFGFKSAE